MNDSELREFEQMKRDIEQLRAAVQNSWLAWGIWRHDPRAKKTVRIWARHRTQFTIGQSLVTISRVRGRGNQFLVKVKTTEETEVRRENTVDNSR